MSAKRRKREERAPLRHLSKQEIDRRIEAILRDLGAAIDTGVGEGGAGPEDPLRPRLIPVGALTGRMRRLTADN
jgi:hypothetical protein